MFFITHNNRLFNSLYCPSYIGKSCKVLNVWCHCYQLQPIRETEYNRGNTDFLIFSIHFRKYFQSDNWCNIWKCRNWRLSVWKFLIRPEQCFPVCHNSNWVSQWKMQFDIKLAIKLFCLGKYFSMLQVSVVHNYHNIPWCVIYT